MNDTTTVGAGQHVGLHYAADPHDSMSRPSRGALLHTDSAVVGVVLAGGQGSRLAPLTRAHAKPAVAFGARHRIIDFALSNLVNSQIRSVYVLLQHHARSVRDHLRSVWHTVPGDSLVQPLHSDGRPFRGTADAVRQTMDRLQLHSADDVFVFGADHIYRMDARQMLDVHRRHDADVTIAALPVPRAHARDFGIIGCDSDGRVRAFLEKPADPPAMPNDSTRSLASMGNYCFAARALLRAMVDCAEIEDLDFGKHVIPLMLRQARRVYAYDFGTNRIAGMQASEGYWRDVGTLDAYFDATLDTLGAQPRFDLDSKTWPIHVAGRAWPHARLLRAQLRDARIGPGALVREASIVRSIVRRAATVEDDVELEECIVLDGARIGKGARLKRAIIDRDATVPAYACIGYDREHDARNHLVTSSGVTVVSGS